MRQCFVAEIDGDRVSERVCVSLCEPEVATLRCQRRGASHYHRRTCVSLIWHGDYSAGPD